MAQSLIECLAADFEPDEFADDYREALSAAHRRQARGSGSGAGRRGRGRASAEVVDLLTALQRSVERARSSRGEDAGGAETAADKAAAAETNPVCKSAAAKTAPSTAKKAPAKKAAASAGTAKGAAKTAKTAAKSSTAKSAEKAPAKRTRKSA